MTEAFRPYQTTKDIYQDKTILSDLINRCIEGERKAQGELYTHFSPKIYPICLRYARDEHHAMDLLHDSFMIIYNRLETFQYKGSFEGWMKRVAVTTALQEIRKNKKMVYQEDNPSAIQEEDTSLSVESDHTIPIETLFELIRALPEGCKMVFNLYQLDGYKHHEIAKLLNVSEGTSKSQYFKAKKILRESIKNYEQGRI